MYPIPSAARALFEAEQMQTIRVTGNTVGGVAVDITAADIMAGSFNIDRYCCNGSKIEFGTAIAAEMTMSLNNFNGKYDGVNFEGAELFIEIGIADWNQLNPTVYYIPCGYFIIDEQTKRQNIVRLKGLDRMMLFDRVPPANDIAWTNEDDDEITAANGEAIEFAATPVLPASVINLIGQCCEQCGVTLGNVFSNPANGNYMISKMPVTGNQVTYRDLIRWCAGLMGTCAFIDWNGKLRFSWYGINDTPSNRYTTTTANRFDGDIQENDITITGFMFTAADGSQKYIYSGDPNYMIDLSDNLLITHDVASVLENLYSVRGGFTYRPMTATVKAAPYVFPLDAIYYVDKAGVSHDAIVTNVNFGMNCLTKLEGRGDSEKFNSYVAPSGLTAQQSTIVRGYANVAEQMTKALNESLDQEEIFNRLTNNGTAQGMTLEEPVSSLGADVVKQLYFNGDYLVRGVITDKSGKNYWILDDGENSGKLVTREGVIGNFTVSDGVLSGNGENEQHMLSKCTISINGVEYEVHYTSFDITRKVLMDGTGLQFFVDDEKRTYIAVQNNGMTVYCFDNSGSMSTPMDINDGSTGTRQITFNYPVVINGDFTATGTKSRAADAGEYGKRLYYAYETPTPMFGDLGEGVIADDGSCHVFLDPVFAQTIETEGYHVFLQAYGPGVCWVDERKGDGFTVMGTPHLPFGWEVKAVQKGYASRRLDKVVPPAETGSDNYCGMAERHIAEIRKERAS